MTSFFGYYQLNSPNAYIPHTHQPANCVGYAFSGANSDIGPELTHSQRMDIRIDVYDAMKYFGEWGFYEQTSITQVGYIAIWVFPGGSPIEHAAVLSSYDPRYGWRVDQVNGTGGPFVHDALLNSYTGRDPDFFYQAD